MIIAPQARRPGRVELYTPRVQPKSPTDINARWNTELTLATVCTRTIRLLIFRE